MANSIDDVAGWISFLSFFLSLFFLRAEATFFFFCRGVEGRLLMGFWGVMVWPPDSPYCANLSTVSTI